MKVACYQNGFLEEGQVITPSRHMNEKYKFIPANHKECRKLPQGLLMTQYFTWKNFSIYYHIFQVHRKLTVRQKTDRPVASIDFILEGDAAMQVQKDVLTPLKGRSCRLRYHPKGETEIILQPGTYQWLYAELGATFLEEFAEGNVSIRNLLEHVMNASQDTLPFTQTGISYETQRLLDQLLSLKPNPSYTTLEIRLLLERLVRQYMMDAHIYVPIPAADGMYYNELHQLRREIYEAPNAHTHTIKHISRKFSIPERQLTKQYFALFGISLEEDVRTRLMAYARELVITTDKTFDDISDELGYSDRRSFTRAIRRYTGLRPSDIRKSYGKNINTTEQPPEQAQQPES